MEFIKKNMLIIESITLMLGGVALFFAEEQLLPISILLWINVGKKSEQWKYSSMIGDFVHRLVSNPNKKMFSKKNWHKDSEPGKWVVIRMLDVLQCMRESGLLMERDFDKNEEK